MIRVQPIELARGTAVGVMVELPKMRVLSISTDTGCVMNGMLDTAILDELQPARQIVAARVTGVREIEDLLRAKVRDCTRAATELGIQPGMTGQEALDRML